MYLFQIAHGPVLWLDSSRIHTLSKATVSEMERAKRLHDLSVTNSMSLIRLMYPYLY